MAKDKALQVVGSRINICLSELQEFKDNQKVQELELIYKDIGDIELTGVEDDKDTSFNLYDYSF